LPAIIYCGTGLPEDRRKINAYDRLAIETAGKIFSLPRIFFSKKIDLFHTADAAIKGTDVLFIFHNSLTKKTKHKKLEIKGKTAGFEIRKKFVGEFRIPFKNRRR